MPPKEIFITEVIIEMEGIKMASQPGPQGPYPMYQPVYQPPHRSTGETLKSLLLSDMVLTIAFGLGLILMWIGALIYGLSNDGDAIKIGMVVQSFGVLLLTGGLLVGGFVRNDIDKHVRYGMLIAGILLLIFVGFWGSPIVSGLTSLLP